MENYQDKIKQYLDTSISILNEIRAKPNDIERIFTVIKSKRNQGRKIFLIGNGGSSSTASHFVCDLNKTSRNTEDKKSRAYSLTDNTPTVFAFSNDFGFKSVFVEQLKNLLEKEDLLIAISGSGKSENVLEAVKYANDVGATTIGLTGFDGGLLKELCNECFIVPSDKMYHIEDVHLMINHIITFLFTGYFYQEK